MYVKNLVGRILSRGPVSVTLAVVLSVLVVTATVGAATTISTNIDTGGTLTVSGVSALNGDVRVNGYATTTAASGNIATEGSLKVGPVGTAVSQIIRGTCTLTISSVIAATSTGYANCAVSSGTVASGDLVFVTLATTTTAVGNSFIVAGAQASTTSSTSITVKLINLSYTAIVPTATAGFGVATQYLIIR
jgi:hypothetical protein